MKRRAFLTAAGSGIALSAGCLGGSSSSGSNGESAPAVELDPEDPAPSVSEAGLAPDPVDVPERDIDKSRFEDYETQGITIKLIPLDVAHYWYHTQKARFADARVRDQYEAVRAKGAAHSPAPKGGDGDPLDVVRKSSRIVTYCNCPHHLSGIRAANLLKNGYTGVYALDPGIDPWVENDYPIAGTDSTNPNMDEYPDDYSRVDDSE